jgi:hypothetical protein
MAQVTIVSALRNANAVPEAHYLKKKGKSDCGGAVCRCAVDRSCRPAAKLAGIPAPAAIARRSLTGGVMAALRAF